MYPLRGRHAEKLDTPTLPQATSSEFPKEGQETGDDTNKFADASKMSSRKVGRVGSANYCRQKGRQAGGAPHVHETREVPPQRLRRPRHPPSTTSSPTPPSKTLSPTRLQDGRALVHATENVSSAIVFVAHGAPPSRTAWPTFCTLDDFVAHRGTPLALLDFVAHRPPPLTLPDPYSRAQETC